MEVARSGIGPGELRREDTSNATGGVRCGSPYFTGPVIGEINSQEAGNLLRVLDSHLTCARRAFPANPNNFEDPGLSRPAAAVL